MTAADVKKFLQMIVMKGNASPDAKKIIEEWCGHYPGKIIQVETEGEVYHVILTKKKVRFAEGEYPSPDLIFRGDSKAFMDVFTGKKLMKDAMASWELVVIGAAHEALPMARLITTVLMGV